MSGIGDVVSRTFQGLKGLGESLATRLASLQRIGSDLRAGLTSTVQGKRNTQPREDSSVKEGLRSRSLSERCKNAFGSTAKSRMPAGLADLGLESKKLYAKVKETFAEKKHPLQQAANDEGLSLSEYKKAIRSTCEKEAEHIPAGESREVSIGEPAQIFHVRKDSDGNLEIIYRQKQLGSGAMADVYLSYSLDTKKERVLKYSKKDIIGANEDVKNESRIVGLLNEGRSKPPEGLPGPSELSQTQTVGAKEDEKITSTDMKLYKKGDLQSQVTIRRMAAFLGIPVKKMIKMNEGELKTAIETKMKSLQYGDTKSSAAAYDDFFKNELSIIYSTVSPREARDVDRAAQTLWEKGKKAECIEKLTEGLCAAIPKIKNISYTPRGEMCRLGANLVAGLLTMHEHHVFHKDIKPSNFLVSTRGAIIADFGASQSLAHPDDLQHFEIPTGTSGYSTAAARDAMTHYKAEGDVANCRNAAQTFDQRATGIALYEMITGGSVPDEDEKDKAKYTDIKTELISAGVPIRAAIIISQMCEPPPPFNKGDPPSMYQPSVSQNELRELYLLLKTS